MYLFINLTEGVPVHNPVETMFKHVNSECQAWHLNFGISYNETTKLKVYPRRVRVNDSETGKK